MEQQHSQSETHERPTGPERSASENHQDRGADDAGPLHEPVYRFLPPYIVHRDLRTDEAAELVERYGLKFPLVERNAPLSRAMRLDQVEVQRKASGASGVDRNVFFDRLFQKRTGEGPLSPEEGAVFAATVGRELLGVGEVKKQQEIRLAKGELRDKLPELHQAVEAGRTASLSAIYSRVPGLGVGKGLVRKLVNYAVNVLGCDTVVLRVSQEKGKRLYKELDFKDLSYLGPMYLSSNDDDDHGFGMMLRVPHLPRGGTTALARRR